MMNEKIYWKTVSRNKGYRNNNNPKDPVIKMVDIKWAMQRSKNKKSTWKKFNAFIFLLTEKTRRFISLMSNIVNKKLNRDKHFTICIQRN